MKDVDAVVLLGGGTDGTLKPAHYTGERLRAYLKLNPRIKMKPVVLSGGYSLWIKKPRHTEAEVMQRYLAHHGISKNRIYVETKSRDTLGNAYFSKQITRKFPSWKKLLVITTDGHVPRSRWIFRKIFGPNYRVSFLGVPSRFGSFASNPNRKKYESYLINAYKNILKTAESGDDKKILRLLKSSHLAFSKSKKALALGKQISIKKQELLGYLSSTKL
ncbi:MAG: YdcF family protein [Patescibacteria group bacterium]